MFAKSPLYLSFSKSGYTFRYSLPKDVRFKLGRREMKVALKTYDFATARRYARSLASTTEKIVSDIRNGGTMAALTNSQIKEYLKRYVLNDLKSDEEFRLLKGNFGEESHFNQYCRENLCQQLRDADYNFGKIQYEEFSLGKQTFDENDPSFKKLAREIMKTHLRLLDIYEKRFQGDYSNELRQVADILASIDAISGEPSGNENSSESQGRMLSELIVLYGDECRRAKKWKERTELEMSTTFDLLKRILGDVPIKKVAREDIATFKTTLMKLPPNINKIRAYRNKTIPELIEYVRKNNLPLLSMVTVDKILGRVNALFTYANTHGYIESNPASGITVAVTKSARTVIASFTDNDLFQMFNCEFVTKDRFRYPYQFWLPVLAPFTGCRLDEMCQLHLSDIRQEDGIWVLDINDNAPDKNLKTESSERLIPLHPFLVDELNFPAFVEKLKQSGEKRLFPELTRDSKGGYGRAMTRWFPKFREKAGVSQYDDKGHKRVFHSFRHTFDTRLKHKYVKTTMVDELMGHAVEKLSMGTYGAKYPVRQIFADAIMKLDFDLANFAMVKNCRFVHKR